MIIDPLTTNQFFLLDDTNDPLHGLWLDEAHLFANAFLEMGRGIGTNGSPTCFVWSETRPYADPFPVNQEPPEITAMTLNAAGDEMTLTLTAHGTPGERLEIYYKDLTATDTLVSTGGWSIAALDIASLGQTKLNWVDDGSGGRGRINTVFARIYLFGRGDIDSDGDRLAGRAGGLCARDGSLNAGWCGPRGNGRNGRLERSDEPDWIGSGVTVWGRERRHGPGYERKRLGWSIQGVVYTDQSAISVGYALDFNGVNDWVDVTGVVGATPLTNLTLEGWFRDRVLSGERVLVSRAEAGERSYELSLVDGRLHFLLSGDGTNHVELAASNTVEAAALRRLVTVSNQSASALVNHQVEVAVDYDPRMRTDFSDLFFDG